MKFLFEPGKKLDTESFVEIIDFYKPITNLYGNLFLYDQLRMSQNLFLKNERGTVKIPQEELKEKLQAHYLELLIYQNHNTGGFREFRLHYDWIKRDTPLNEISNITFPAQDYVAPLLILDAIYMTNFDNHPFVCFRLGRYDNGKFVVFIHPSNDAPQSGFIETHESHNPIRIPAEE